VGTQLPTPGIDFTRGAPLPTEDGILPNGAGGPITLRVWLPALFDPRNGTPAGKILQDRLNEFASQHAEVRLDVRIKSPDGTGGMLESLSAANAAAPDALPDLAALSRPELERAALKGLLQPFEDLSEPLESPDWYDFAAQLGRLQQVTYGLPFAGDALALIYRANEVGDPPRDLPSALASKGPLAFPAGDPQSLYTLALYQAAGGTLQDAQGRPALDPAPLTRVLTYYQQAESASLTPAWLAQLENDDQAWAAYQDGRAFMVISWASRLLPGSANLPLGSNIAPLPALEGSSYTLASGWAWTLPGSRPEERLLATQLAEFLSSPDFLARWTQTAGYLPPRASALAAWSDSPGKSLASQIVLSAHLIPTADLLAPVGTTLRQATMNTLNHQGEPAELAKEASDFLK
jgi:maltose-binding protein MalE